VLRGLEVEVSDLLGVARQMRLAVIPPVVFAIEQHERLA